MYTFYNKKRLAVIKMVIRALADLHLSSKVNKPMDIFGPDWDNHVQKIKQNWEENVKEDDLVIIPGDISWAMHLKEAIYDLEWISNLHGKKLLLRGNHDYWWSSLKKIREALPPDIEVLQNDHFFWEGWAICGTRGWLCPGDYRFEEEQDQKIYLRETLRLEFSLKSAYDRGHRKIIVATHFPPFNVKRDPSGFTELMEEYRVEICIYGHLHGEAINTAYEGQMNGTNYVFVSADKLNFTPILIAE